MNTLLAGLIDKPPFSDIIENIQQKNSPLLLQGALSAQKCHILATINSKNKNAPTIFITYSELKAKELQADLSFFVRDRDILLYPAKDIIFYSADVRSLAIVKERLHVLEELLEDKNPIVVLSIESLFSRITPKDKFKSYVINMKVSDEIDYDTLIDKLMYMGYERRQTIEGPGHFAIRGGIMDIATAHGAFRIEFFGDEIDSIRTLDIYSQRSQEKIANIKITPIRELVYYDDELQMATELINEEYTKLYSSYIKKGLELEGAELKKSFFDDINRLNNKERVPNLDRFFQYFYKEETTLLDYLNKDTIIYFDELDRIKKQGAACYNEFIENAKERILSGHMLPSQQDMFFSYDLIIEKTLKFVNVIFSSLGNGPQDFDIKYSYNFNTASVGTLKNQVDILEKELKIYKEKNATTIILSGTKLRGQNLEKELIDRGLSASYIENLDKDLVAGTITITKGSLSEGFIYKDLNLVLISDRELFGEQRKKSNAKKKVRIDDFTSLKEGDYVVHDTHGIGIYHGIETILTDGISRDYLKLAYSDGGKLYISTSQLDRIQKYIGGDSPKTHKLGTSIWEKTKEKAKNAVKLLSKDLSMLYAKRNNSTGYSFSVDTVWQKEFESQFSYNETSDQLHAIEDVKKDMETNKVMDRLICGDVGYGKTEIAIRAAFKAAQDSKQVAILAPTTILATQHYNTFVSRFKDFPITIELLSRFRTKKQQAETIEKLKNGTVDIIIGTHRLLSKDIEFKDLGLVVIDEEQRFGVTHKEKLKKLTINVDVLTLTATPIPRTLNMGLAGIRDISILTEPPTERKPIQTYVLEYNEQFIKTAIQRELARSGQVYYLHNRVQNITRVVERLKELIPEAKIAYAHGQLSEIELENTMMDFYEKEIDVLVCTTIIETGLDIPNVNTIIIQDADRMGLSQLYQLRGRVGRSDKIAYSYLMYKKDKILDEIAEKRLQTIRDFTEFGSGFKVAMKDLELRGVGSLLGEKQHGNIGVVGYDMYIKLLEECMKELKGEKIVPDLETLIDIKISAYIPTSLIEDKEKRLEMYKKIAHIKTLKDLYDVQEEIEDRYGDMPESVQLLLDIALLKEAANKLGIISVIQKENNIVAVFDKSAKISPEKIANIFGKYPNLFFTSQATTYMTYKCDKKVTSDHLLTLKDIMEELA